MGSCRRDLLDHVIILNERHLKRLLSSSLLYYKYVSYYPTSLCGWVTGTSDARAAVSPSIIASKARTKNKLILGHQAACLILRGSLAAFAFVWPVGEGWARRGTECICLRRVLGVQKSIKSCIYFR